MVAIWYKMSSRVSRFHSDGSSRSQQMRKGQGDQGERVKG